MAKHSESTNVHIPYAWTYNDQTEREAATGFAAADVGKLARQLDDNSLWMLTDDSPETWVAIGGSLNLASDKVVRTAGDYTTSSTTFVDIDGTNVTITVSTGARRCLVVLTCWGTNSSGAQNTSTDLLVDGARQGGTYGLMNGIGANNNLGWSFLTDVLSAGSHTFKPQWKVDGGSGTLYASSVSPLTFFVIELP